MAHFYIIKLETFEKFPKFSKLSGDNSYRELEGSSQFNTAEAAGFLVGRMVTEDGEVASVAYSEKFEESEEGLYFELIPDGRHQNPVFELEVGYSYYISPPVVTT